MLIFFTLKRPPSHRGILRSINSNVISRTFNHAVISPVIELYSVAIGLGSASDAIFAGRCEAKLGKMLCEDALLDAKKERRYLLFRRPSSMVVLRSFCR